jgi:hypothetical protein
MFDFGILSGYGTEVNISPFCHIPHFVAVLMPNFATFIASSLASVKNQLTSVLAR